MGCCSGRPLSGRSAKVSFGPEESAQRSAEEPLARPKGPQEESSPALEGGEERRNWSPQDTGTRPEAPEASQPLLPSGSERPGGVRRNAGKGVASEVPAATPPAPQSSAQQGRVAPRQVSGQAVAAESSVVQRLRRELALEKQKSAACQEQLDQAAKSSRVSTWAADAPWVEVIESSSSAVWLRVGARALPGVVEVLRSAHRKARSVRVLLDDQLSSVPGLPRALLTLVLESIPVRVAPRLFLVRSPECDRWGHPELKVPEGRVPDLPRNGERYGRSSPVRVQGAYVVLDVKRK